MFIEHSRTLDMILTIRRKLEEDRDVSPMVLVRVLSKGVWAVRNVFDLRYHPERHYMRGPGPAYARKQRLEESLRAEKARDKVNVKRPKTNPQFAPRT